MSKTRGISIFLIYFLTRLAVTASPDISLDITRFRNGSASFIEVSVYVVGASLVCDTTKNTFGLDYLIVIKDTLGNIDNAAKFNLIKEGCPAKDILDVRRFPLTAGHYIVELTGMDVNDSLSEIVITTPVTIHDSIQYSWLSDIQLLGAMTKDPDGNSPMHKHGIYMEALPFHFYYPALNTLHVYLEAYNAAQLTGQPYIQYSIYPVVGDVPQPIITYKKISKEQVAPNVFQIDISKLITGYYRFDATLFDGDKNKVQTQSVIFTRLNPTGDSIFLAGDGQSADLGFASRIPVDSIDYVLKAMAPIATSLDVEVINTLLKKDDLKSKQYFIHKFWTNQSGKYAGPAFQTYMKVATVVDVTYRSGFGYGFETDRGFIFLKYGQPNDILAVEDEPSAPPYEIWFYHNFPTTHQTNVRFLFYNPSLVTNGHKLLHSNANGERKNPLWEVELYRDATLETPGVNETKMGDNVHRNARTYFEN